MSSRRPLHVWLPAIRAGSGADVFVQRLANGLVRRGHVAHVQWFAHALELVPSMLWTVTPPADADVVHANSWQAFAFKRAGLPLVVTEHQYVSHPAFAALRSPAQRLYHRLLVERWMRRSYRAADALIAVSDFCARAMRAELSVPVKVIHNWVDIASFSPTGSPGAWSPGQPVRLLFVGNPSRWKGYDLLPTLAEKLGSGYQIQVLGGLRSGGRRSMPSTALVGLDSVAPERMPTVYRAHDIVLIPARYEAFGYVALEAMACGRPVVGFAESGTSEVCVDEVTALLAPLDDLEGLVERIRRLGTSPDLRQRLGAEGRRRAVAHFGEEAAITRYLDVYQEMVATSARGT